MKITLNDLIETYSRFKAYVYYDSFNLTLRQQLADFESDENNILLEKLSKLADEINIYLDTGKLSSILEEKINSSKYISIPKSFKAIESEDKSCTNKIFITNKNISEYSINKLSLLYNGDIEIHLISTLWIIKEGYKLINKIGYDNYGYHLPLDDNKKLCSEKILFTKYFEKYQEWRDRGIKAAKKQIEDGNDVMLISLDVKNFFHSSRIDFTLLKHDIGLTEKFSLTSLLEIIYIDHTKKILNENSNFPILPIGLVSSGVIANWFLSDFDRELKDKTSPVYYGRYVDDIFIVVSNIEPPKEIESCEQIINWLSKRYFYDSKPLKKYKIDNEIGFTFSDKKYKGLKIQSEKLKLFYFSPDWPHAMLNKFQKALEENSSAFWFLPDEEEMKDSLDDEAYDMHYEDTINKFRSISDIKASKYGASVFLAKKIKLAILHNSSPDDKITTEVFRFFKGVSKISLFNMWEKVFTYLVVTNDLKSISKLYNEIFKSINKITFSDSENISNNNELLINVKNTLQSHLDISLQLSLSLNPKLLYKFPENQNIILKKEKIETGVLNLRKSLLTRHHYLIYPYLVLTDYYRLTNGPLLAKDLFQNLMTNNSFAINEDLKINSWKLPRWINLQEINSLILFLEIKNFKNSKPLFYKKDIDEKTNQNYYNDEYINDSIYLFKTYNNKELSKIIFSKKYKQYKDLSSNEIKIFTNSIGINDEDKIDQIKIGLSNFRLSEFEIKTAISDSSILNKNKRIKHINILNQAEKEKVDLLLLPETCVPIEWLYAYTDESRRKGRAFIFGLEHFTVNQFCFNFSICILPFTIGKRKESLIIPRLKNHYSPHESNGILTFGKKVPKQITSFYHLIKWKKLQFSIYNCYELTDVLHRSIFKSELDILFAIEYNKDINYFSNIGESINRDLHCYFIQANTSYYGDSRIIEPKETIHMNPVRVKGGENDIILKHELDIKKLRDFQLKRLPQQLSDKSFKTTPPEFDHEKVKNRGQ